MTSEKEIHFPKIHNFVDLTDKTFGKLTVKRYLGSEHNKSIWLCVCECGKEKRVVAYHLTNGDTKSCGCLRGKCRIKHGRAKTPLHRVWCAMRERCYDENNQAYHNYGGRGIKVCDRWLESFNNFLEDMGERPSDKYSIDRRDNDGNYCKENCYWATWIEQGTNKRNNHYLEYNGEKLTISQWSRKLGYSVASIRNRIQRGWSIEKTLTTPTRKVNK